MSLLFLFIIVILISYIIYQKKIIKNFKDNFFSILKNRSVSKVPLSGNDDLDSVNEELNSIILENQKLRVEIENLNKKHREILANLSHDLRTPLTSILGYLDLIDDKENSYLKTVKEKSQFLSKLIERFYEYSLASINESLDFELIDLYELLAQALLFYYDDFNKKNIEVEFCLEENIKILSDLKSLKSIVFNALDNMLKYSKSHSKIEYNKEKKSLYFINDTDLKDGDYDYLFGRSVVIEKSRNSTGLGLAIIKEYLTKIKARGKIYVKDKNFILEIDL